MNNKIDTILFDLDDTLIIEWKSAEESFIETIKQIDIKIDIEEFIKTIRTQAKEEWYKLPTIDYCLRIGISSWEGLWADFSGDNADLLKLHELSTGYRFNTWFKTLIKFGIQSEQLADRLSSDFKRIRNSKHVLYPDTISVLRKLRKSYKLGLITNGAPDLQWKKINGGNLKDYFNYIAISGEHNAAKPNSQLFDIVIKGLKSEIANTLIVGDSLNTDIKGGQDFGLLTIWINRNNDIAKMIRPDFELSNLTDIEKIITTLPNTR